MWTAESVLSLSELSLVVVFKDLKLEVDLDAFDRSISVANRMFLGRDMDILYRTTSTMFL